VFTLGIATLPNLAPGRYRIEAQFPGFEPRVLANVAGPAAFVTSSVPVTVTVAPPTTAV
jgi:hypothetical protein